MEKLSRRVVSLLTLLLLLLSTAGEGFGFHPCPHHSQHSSDRDAHPASDHGHGQHDESSHASPGGDCADLHLAESGDPATPDGLEPCPHFEVCHGGPVTSVAIESDALVIGVAGNPA